MLIQEQNLALHHYFSSKVAGRAPSNEIRASMTSCNHLTRLKNLERLQIFVERWIAFFC